MRHDVTTHNTLQTARHLSNGLSKGFAILALSLVAIAAAAQHGHHAQQNANWGHEVVRNGAWNSPQTWRDGEILGDDARVRVLPGVTVELRRQNTVNLGEVRVEGRLSFHRNANTRLITDTLTIAPSGQLEIGTASNPIEPNVTAEIVFRDRRSVPFNDERSNLGMMASDQVIIYRSQKTAKQRLLRDATAGGVSLRLDGRASGNWRVNDEVLITSTHFRRGAALQNEVRRIDGWRNRSRVAVLNEALDFSHVRGAGGQMPVYVATLTRNVVFRSATPNTLDARGHIMFMPGSDVDVNYASFIGLGRTNKAANTSSTNPQGRYAFHFHRNGLDTVQKVNGIVVRGTPGWGIVNHSSYVDVRDSVVYDFAGAAFIT